MVVTAHMAIQGLDIENLGRSVTCVGHTMSESDHMSIQKSQVHMWARCIMPCRVVPWAAVILPPSPRHHARLGAARGTAALGPCGDLRPGGGGGGAYGKARRWEMVPWRPATSPSRWPSWCCRDATRRIRASLDATAHTQRQEIGEKSKDMIRNLAKNTGIS